MARDHIVSVRLTDDELMALKRAGKPTEVFRRLLSDAIMRPAAAQTVLPMTTAPIASGYCVHWMDGSVGATWPQAVTR